MGNSYSMERDALRKDFIRQNGWGDAAMSALPVDASRRRYFRLTRGDEQCLLMDVPPHPEENFDAFITIAAALRDAGLSAPQVFATNNNHGFALIEDFGEDTFTRLLNNHHDVRELYHLAIDTMVQLQLSAVPPSDLPIYDNQTLVTEWLRLVDWYYPLWHGHLATDDVRGEFVNIITNILAQLPVMQPVLVLRDFHVDNLMLLPSRNGAAACGLLDFQDGALGHPAYDVLSLLEDARRDIPSDVVASAWERYAAAMPYDANELRLAYDIMGLQRHGRIVGQFIRLWVRDDKPGYLQFMPRVTAQFMVKLQSPIAEELRDWCARHLPQLGEKWPDKPAMEFKKIMCA